MARQTLLEEHLNVAIVEMQKKAKLFPQEVAQHILDCLYNAEASFVQKKVVQEKE